MRLPVGYFEWIVCTGMILFLVCEACRYWMFFRELWDDIREWYSECRKSGLGLFAVLILSVSGCSVVTTAPSVKYPHMERAVAEIALASVGSEPAPDSNPDLPLGTCPQCKGTGTVGDGRTSTTCLMCGGDGQIDPDDTRNNPAVTNHGTITLHITDVTKKGWPDQWYQNQRKAFADRGWSVSYQKHAITAKPSAYIDVCTDGKCWQFYGPIEPKHVRHLEVTK